MAKGTTSSKYSNASDKVTVAIKAGSWADNKEWEAVMAVFQCFYPDTASCSQNFAIY